MSSLQDLSLNRCAALHRDCVRSISATVAQIRRLRTSMILPAASRPKMEVVPGGSL